MIARSGAARASQQGSLCACFGAPFGAEARSDVSARPLRNGRPCRAPVATPSVALDFASRSLA
ncbi:MAG: hypothetical protein AUH85_02355 [Chloroflexi bacterium 13_1_40CM_4_68_4]|nr:MAG: hypothetical protein AUH85_02355 [Chloroflexi bacterium 13_1_40CM_4_68_4]